MSNHKEYFCLFYFMINDNQINIWSNRRPSWNSSGHKTKNYNREVRTISMSKKATQEIQMLGFTLGYFFINTYMRKDVTSSSVFVKQLRD